MPTKTKPAEHGMLFTAPLVRAIGEGLKTQTRRPVTPQPWQVMPARAGEPVWPYGFRYYKGSTTDGEPFRMKSPYGGPGDLIYVRETWAPVPEHRPIADPERYPRPGAFYKADGNRPMWAGTKWKPSIHMPKWAARYWLEITDVRVERVQGIGEEDAIAEGLNCRNFTGWGDESGIPSFPEPDVYELPDGKGWTESPVEAFSQHWDAIYAAKGLGWDANLWCWIYEFKKVEAPNAN